MTLQICGSICKHRGTVNSSKTMCNFFLFLALYFYFLFLFLFRVSYFLFLVSCLWFLVSNFLCLFALLKLLQATGPSGQCSNACLSAECPHNSWVCRKNPADWQTANPPCSLLCAVHGPTYSNQAWQCTGCMQQANQASSLSWLRFKKQTGQDIDLTYTHLMHSDLAYP